MLRHRSSKRRYRSFVQDYRDRRVDEQPKDSSGETPQPKRRQYLRDYIRWLWPHRYAVGALFAMALVVAGLQMVEPLFMRFIVDRVLLAHGVDMSTRLARLQYAGVLFLALVDRKST